MQQAELLYFNTSKSDDEHFSFRGYEAAEGAFEVSVLSGNNCETLAVCCFFPFSSLSGNICETLAEG